MSWLKIFYNEIFYRPLLGALIFLTSVLPGHDLGLAVILLTVIIRALMFPMTHKILKTQNAMKIIEPEVKKIYADKKNKEDQAKALMELYKKHGINPLSGFFILLIQLPILFAMYQVFLYGLPFPAGDVYPFLKIPENINTMFLGFISLTSANIGLSALAALSQFWQAKLALPPKTTSSTKRACAKKRARRFHMPEDKKPQIEFIENTIKNLLRQMGFSFSLEFQEGGEDSWFIIKTQDAPLLIGDNGNHLSALSHVVKRIYEQKFPNPPAGGKLQFLIDINDYNKKRIEEIKDAARMHAQRVRYFKKPMEMKPMNAGSAEGGE